jgi:plasmid stability protein
MKTTLDLPDELVRTMKIMAVHEGRKFKDVAAEIFRRGLAQPESVSAAARRPRVKLPLIRCKHPAAPAQELTPDKVANLLLKQDVDWTHEAARR